MSKTNQVNQETQEEQTSQPTQQTISVKEAAKQFGFPKSAQPFLDLARKYYKDLAKHWRATTQIPVKIVEELRVLVDEYENLQELIAKAENSDMTGEDDGVPEAEQPLAIAPGSEFAGMECQSIADARKMVQGCATALDFAFARLTQDMVYDIYTLAATQAVAEHNVYKTIKSHITQQLSNEDTQSRKAAVQQQVATIQETANQLLVDMGVAPIQETLGNAQRSEKERTDEARKRVEDLKLALQLN